MEVHALGLHGREVADHAAVVADERLALRLGGLQAVRVDDRALGLAAGGREAVLEAAAVLHGEKVVGHAGVEVVPGQAGVHGQGAEVGLGVEVQLGDRFQPAVEAELLVPAVEAAALLVGALDEGGHATVAAADDPLQVAHLAVVPLELHLGAAGHVVEQVLLLADGVHAVHGRPLEGRVRLGNEAAHGAGHLGRALAALDPAAHGEAAGAGFDDAGHVFHGLGGQTDHEVELHVVPLAAEHAPRALEDVLLAHVLVDDVAHPLRAGLGREGERGGAHLLEVVEHGLGQAVGAQARDGQAHLLAVEALHQLVHQRDDGAVVGRGQAGEADLVVARLAQALHHRVDHGLGRALAHGAVDHPGLAEAAALRAAAGQLDSVAVEDRAGLGERRVGGEGVVVDVLHVRADDGVGEVGVVRRLDDFETRVRVGRRGVERGQVAAGRAGQAAQALGAGEAGGLEGGPVVHEARQGLLAVADHEAVDEGRQRLGLEGGGAAGDDERVLLAAVGRAQGDAAEVEHQQDVRVGQLVLQREAHQVELVQRGAGLEGDQGEARRAQLGLHVGPGGEDALGGQVRPLVDHAVENLEPHVAHADLVDVREGQRHAAGELRGVLDHLVLLAAGVATRARDAADDRGIGVAGGEHGGPSRRGGRWLRTIARDGGTRKGGDGGSGVIAERWVGFGGEGEGNRGRTGCARWVQGWDRGHPDCYNSLIPMAQATRVGSGSHLYGALSRWGTAWQTARQGRCATRLGRRWESLDWYYVRIDGPRYLDVPV